MGWAQQAGKQAVKYGVKYGPHAVAAWKVAGPKVQAAARRKAEEFSARRSAFDHASSVTDGSVLRVVDQGSARYVVYSAEDPVASYPETSKPLAELTSRADLNRRESPEERRDRALHNRVLHRHS